MLGLLSDQSRFSSAHSRYLDAWRGGSALVVLVVHVAQIYYTAWPIFKALAAGAVMTFFALSGLLIAKSLQGKDWRKFVIARADRLLLPFLFSLALCVLLWRLAPAVFLTGDRTFAGTTARDAFSLGGLLPTALFLNGFAGDTLSSNGPLWSLSYEVWYYAIAALLVFRRFGLALALFVALTWAEYLFAVFGIVWAAGFVLGWTGLVAPKWWNWVWVIAALLFVAVFIVPDHAAYKAIVSFEICFGIALLIHLSHVFQADAPSVPLLPSTAGFSYSLYVTHFPILLFCFGAGFPVWSAIALALAVAVFSGVTIERVRPVRELLAIGRAPSASPPSQQP